MKDDPKRMKLEELEKEMKEIVCPYCNEEQEYQGGKHHLEVFFSEGYHKLECYQCGNVFRVNTEIRYVYAVEELKENGKN